MAREETEQQQPGPVLWPRLTADEAAEEWPALYDWVEQWRLRYPNGVRIPDCWWRHPDLIEALQALRDCERGCFSPKAPATAAVDFQRATRDIEARLEVWVRRLSCAVPGRGHGEPGPVQPPSSEFDAFVASDVSRRR